MLEFLDHNELGLALQWMVNSLAAARAEVPPQAHAHLAEAAAEMDLGDDPDWLRLRAARQGTPEER